MHSPGPIETARLQIRIVTASDLPDLLKINGDDTVTRFLPYDTWQSLSDAEAWLTRMNEMQASGSTLQFVIADKTSGTVIGSCLLFRYDTGSQLAELGYVLGSSYWGQGYMREALTGLLNEAFNTMNLRRIEAQVNPENVASCKLLLNLGFSEEGRLRQRYLSGRTPYDISLFGLLRHEWLS